MVGGFIPSDMVKEFTKASIILRSFTVTSSTKGPDSVIPADIIMKAEGICILTVLKAGFLITARGGSGLVICKLNDGTWSAPSAIGVAGIGGGFEIGAEVTDFILVLNNKSAVDAFSKGTNVTLGTNLTVAAGPYGRNLEADVAIRSPAAVYTYSKSKGLFAGISLEGTVLIERKGANEKFYGQDGIRARDILAGNIYPPPEAQMIYEALSEHASNFARQMSEKARENSKAFTNPKNGPYITPTTSTASYSSSSYNSSGPSRPASRPTAPASRPANRPAAGGSSSNKSSLNSGSSSSSSSSRSRGASSSSYSSSSSGSSSSRGSSSAPSSRSLPLSANKSASSASGPRNNSVSNGSYNAAAASGGVNPFEQVYEATALFDYHSDFPTDLNFRVGDVIEVLTTTPRQDDWWEGRTADGKKGIFPANFCSLK